MSTPEDLWRHALKLAAAPEDEVQRRHAVSRMYYATFHAVIVLLSFDSRGAHPHERLLGALKATRDPQRVKAAARLDSLRKARNHADYQLNLPFSQDAVHSARNHANAVRELLGITSAPTVEAETPSEVAPPRA